MQSGFATGPNVIAAPDSTSSPLKVHGPGVNLADSTLLELTANGELILTGGSGNGYRFADLGPANNPSGWSGVLKVKTPAGATLGYILALLEPVNIQRDHRQGVSVQAIWPTPLGTCPLHIQRRSACQLDLHGYRPGQSGDQLGQA